MEENTIKYGSSGNDGANFGNNWKSPRTAGMAIQSRVCVCVRKREGVDMWLVQEWRSPSVLSLKGALGPPPLRIRKMARWQAGQAGRLGRLASWQAGTPPELLGAPQGSLEEAPARREKLLGLP